MFTTTERLEIPTKDELMETTAIACEECRRPWIGNERGGQAQRVDLDEIAFYCPDCAEREFGDHA